MWSAGPNGIDDLGQGDDIHAGNTLLSFNYPLVERSSLFFQALALVLAFTYFAARRLRPRVGLPGELTLRVAVALPAAAALLGAAYWTHWIWWGYWILDRVGTGPLVGPLVPYELTIGGTVFFTTWLAVSCWRSPE